MTAQCQKQQFREPSQVSRPLKQAARAGWECVSYTGSARTLCAPETTNVWICVDVHICAHARLRGQRAGAYINHKLSGSGSRTSNEMVQIKVCLWVVCVCVFQHCLRGNKPRISARFDRLWYFWLGHKGILSTCTRTENILN